MIAMIHGFEALCQGYAWATMLYERVPEQGIDQAIDSTFSGEAPCPKCLALKKAKEEREERENENIPVREFSTTAKFIPNTLEILRLTPPPYTRKNHSVIVSQAPPSIYLLLDTPPPDFS